MTETPPQADASDIGQRLGLLTEYVRQCAARVSRGEMLDMTGLDKSIAGICAEVGQLPVIEARKLDAGMQSFIAEIDTLAAAMKEQKNSEAPKDE